MPNGRYIRTIIAVIVVTAGMWCRAEAQTTEELQRQLQAIQQQLDALRGEQATVEATEQGAGAGGQGGGGGAPVGGAVMLRPMETGRSLEIKPQTNRERRQEAAQQEQERRAEARREQALRDAEAREAQLKQQLQQAQGANQGGNYGGQGGQPSYNYYYNNPSGGSQNYGGAQQGGYPGGTAQNYGGGQPNYGGAYGQYEQPRQRGRGYGTEGMYGGGRVYNKVALKTNLLYWGTITPNLGVEFGLGQTITLELSAGFNNWGQAPQGVVDLAGGAKKRQLDHTLGKAEFKIWFQERFVAHNIGLHVFYTGYDIYGVRVPLLFEKEMRYEGSGVGVGITYGYRWAWSERWGMDLSIGAGMIMMNYDKYAWAEGGTASTTPEAFKKTYFGPTNLGLKLFFMIN